MRAPGTAFGTAVALTTAASGRRSSRSRMSSSSSEMSVRSYSGQHDRRADKPNASTASSGANVGGTALGAAALGATVPQGPAADSVGSSSSSSSDTSDLQHPRRSTSAASSGSDGSGAAPAPGTAVPSGTATGDHGSSSSQESVQLPPRRRVCLRADVPDVEMAAASGDPPAPSMEDDSSLTACPQRHQGDDIRIDRDPLLSATTFGDHRGQSSPSAVGCRLVRRGITFCEASAASPTLGEDQYIVNPLTPQFVEEGGENLMEGVLPDLLLLSAAPSPSVCVGRVDPLPGAATFAGAADPTRPGAVDVGASPRRLPTLEWSDLYLVVSQFRRLDLDTAVSRLPGLYQVPWPSEELGHLADAMAYSRRATAAFVREQIMLATLASADGNVVLQQLDGLLRDMESL